MGDRPSTSSKDRQYQKCHNDEFMKALGSSLLAYRNDFPCQEFLDRVKNITDSKPNQKVRGMKRTEKVYKVFKLCLEHITSNKTKHFSDDKTQMLLNNLLFQLGYAMNNAGYLDHATISEIISVEKAKLDGKEWVAFNVVIDAFNGLVDKLTRT